MSELKEFVQSHAGDKIDKDRYIASQIAASIISEFKSMKQIAEAMQTTEPYAKGNFPSQIISAGCSSRDHFCRLVTSTTDKVRESDQNYDSIKSFQFEVKDILKQLELNPKAAELLVLCFEKEAKLLDTNLMRIRKWMLELTHLLSEESTLASSTKLDSKLIQVEELKISIAKTQKELADFDNQLKTLYNEKFDIQKKIIQFSLSSLQKKTKTLLVIM